ncbi:nucleotidyltransferase family protein [Mucilaginibacter sp. ZT4R22]|uniref:Nucleotidyltransferase family protein n=1 Tax=Mucilaginibacter pankratovii TaxID=2772110 RepID=A0ABR7WZ63_9SPHI|nr:nucleotidyltransferase family protein [Mucilaginibacter pankratovii]MBD1366739.1 nucleotidyltransferase family protein [Mucilaginibacter pankratovii]
MAGIIILAAGESKRLGQPKQNLVFKGKTLLRHAIDTALDSACSPIVVVLGANGEQITIQPNKKVTILQNPDWPEGMASSIRLAIHEMIKQGAESAFIMLCDQPFVDTQLLNAMLQQQKDTGKPIIACAYKGAAGVPVLFNKSLFPDLLLLQGHEGARKILQDRADDIARIPFENGGIDIDTIDDYEALIGRQNVN